jgi:hypothetical protein
MSLRTYDSRKVLISLGSHSVSEYADGSFISIEAHGEGVGKKVGADGEVIRSLDPDHTATVTITLLQQSPTVPFCQDMYQRDQLDGSGTFPILIKDMKGGLIFSAQDAWVQSVPTREFAIESTNREVVIDCGDVEWDGEMTA